MEYSREDRKKEEVKKRKRKAQKDGKINMNRLHLHQREDGRDRERTRASKSSAFMRKDRLREVVLGARIVFGKLFAVARSGSLI